MVSVEEDMVSVEVLCPEAAMNPPGVCVCVCARARVRVCERERARVSVCERVCVCECVHTVRTRVTCVHPLN